MKKFINIKELSQTYIIDVFLDFEYPRIFVCKNKSNKLFLFAECFSNNLSEKWLVIEITDKDYKDLITNISTIQQAYENHNKECILIVHTLRDKKKRYSKRDIGYYVEELGYFPSGVLGDCRTYVKDIKD